MFNFKQFHVFFTSFSSILNRKYLLLHCCCVSGGTFVSETVDWNAKGSPSLAILRRDHAQVLWALAQLPPTQVINCFELVHIDGGLIREQMRELGARESEVQRIFAGLRQAVSSQVLAHKHLHKHMHNHKHKHKHKPFRLR